MQREHRPTERVQDWLLPSRSSKLVQLYRSSLLYESQVIKNTTSLFASS